MNDEDLYLKATNEVSGSERKEALWAKANTLTEGDQDKAKYIYIKMRVEQLKDFQDESQSSQLEQRNSKGPLILEVTQSFSLFENAFVYQGVDYSYGGVSSIYYNGSVTSINFISSGSESMSLTHDECGDIDFDAEFTLIKSKKYKNISHAANILYKKTYRGRMLRYMDKLKTQGFISEKQIKFKNNYKDWDEWEVRIYENGDVVEKEKRFNLKKAYNNKSLQIGYSAYLGIEGKTNPYEVIVSESGTAFWNKKIKFDITRDTDVMSSILMSLAGVKSK